MRFAIVFGGSEQAVDNIKQRILKRLPQATVDIYDKKNGWDATMSADRQHLTEKVRSGFYHRIFVCPPCTSFTIRYRRKLRDKSAPEKCIATDDPSLVKICDEHTMLNTFALLLFALAEQQDGVECIMETTADRGDDPTHDAFWEKFKDHASPYDLPLAVALVERRGASRIKLASCTFGAAYQKYIEVLVSAGIARRMHELFEPHKVCTHAAHERIIEGVNEDGEYVSVESERYLPQMSDVFACGLIDDMIPADCRQPSEPPFDDPNVLPLRFQAKRANFNDVVHATVADDNWLASGAQSSAAWCAAIASTLASSAGLSAHSVWNAHAAALPRENELAAARHAANDLMMKSIGLQFDMSAAKATQGSVQIATPLGPKIFNIPSSDKQVRESHESESWMESDRGGHNVIIMAGNELVRLDMVPQEDEVANVVTVRKIKVDQSTGNFDTHKSFSSRHSYDDSRIERRVYSDSPTTTHVADDLSFKMFIAIAALRKRRLYKFDVGNAYARGVRNRRPSYMRIPSTIRDEFRDADGMEMVYKLNTPMWGEHDAGGRWDETLHAALIEAGFRQSEGIPALYYFHGPGICVHMLKIVDDMLVSVEGPGDSIIESLRDILEKRFPPLNGTGALKFEADPTSFAGYKIELLPGGAIRLSQPTKLVAAVREHLPQLIDGERPKHLLTGAKLRKALDELEMVKLEPGQKLTKDAKVVQRIVGALKYPEAGSMPVLTLPVHRLSCVMSSPPPQARAITESVLAEAYDRRNDGIVFGRVGLTSRPTVEGSTKVRYKMNAGAPVQIEAAGDAATGKINIASMLVTCNGGSVYHKAKKIDCKIPVESIHGAEAFALDMTARIASLARLLAKSLGAPCSGATLVVTDSLSNERVANNSLSASRCKHLLLRYEMLKARISAGEIAVMHVPDTENPSDFLTKWVPIAKLKRSLAYVGGREVTDA